MKHGRMGKLSEEREQSFGQRKLLSEALLEDWTKTDIGFGLNDLFIKNPQKARNTVMAIQLQENYMKLHMNETLISTTFNTTPENVLKIVRLGTANSIRGDVFTEYPLQTVDDAIYWIDMTREKAYRGSTAGEKAYQTINEFYAGEQTYKDTTATATDTFAIDMSTDVGGQAITNVVSGKIIILLNGKFVGSDVVSPGVITPNGDLLSSGTVADYDDTLVVNLVFASNLAITDTIRVIYHWNSEILTDFDNNLGTVGINVRKQRFDARPMPLGYSFTDMTALTFSSTGLGDVHDMLISQVGDEHAKRRDYRSIAHGRAIATANENDYRYNANFAAVGEVSANEHAQNIYGKIDDIGGDIYDKIQRGGINTCVAGSRALTYMKKHDKWSSNGSARKEGPYEAGMLDDIRVFATPAKSNILNNNEILLTFKNPQEGADVSVAYGNFTELSAELRYPSLRSEGTIATVEDHLDINTDFLQLLTIDNLPSD